MYLVPISVCVTFLLVMNNENGGWMNGWMDGWMDGYIYMYVHVCMHSHTYMHTLMEIGKVVLEKGNDFSIM